MPPHEVGESMMSICLAVEPVNPAAIRAFDAAVGGNRQKYARMAVPGFVRGAAAMQGQVGGGDDDGGMGLVGHGVVLIGSWHGGWHIWQQLSRFGCIPSTWYIAVPPYAL